MISPRTRAMMLLTVHLDARSPDAPEPLNLREWNHLARWLHGQELTPEALLEGNPWAILSNWENPRVEIDRLLRLLERGPSLALAQDRWAGSGIWVLNRSEPAYPRRLKERLRSSAPVLLFGYGDITLARRKGVAIVGSRNATRDARDHAHALAERVVAAGYSVVSGGARGIDEVAVDSAIEHGGTAIAVLPASLLRYASKRKLRDFLATERLVLVTPYSPEAGFTAGNAIGRNKLIYCLADTAVAMCSTNGSGGTYAGGIQDLQKQWVPLWVAPTDDPASGNHVLVEAGARWLPTGPSLDVHQLFDPGDPIHGTAVDQASATPQQQAS